MKKSLLERWMEMDRLLCSDSVNAWTFGAEWGVVREQVLRDLRELRRLGYEMELIRQGPGKPSLWKYKTGQRPLFTVNLPSRSPE